MKELSRILERRVKDPRLDAATVTAVKITVDLKLARIYYCVFGADDEAKAQVKDAFAKAKGFLRSELGKNMGLRYTPALEFFYDDTFDHGQRINSLLAQVKDDIAPDEEDDD